MSFVELIKKYDSFDINESFKNVTVDDVDKSLKKEKLSERDLINLLSPAASGRLEEMAQKAHRTTIQYFGRTIALYIPLYISNYCSNGCTYCGFHSMEFGGTGGRGIHVLFHRRWCVAMRTSQGAGSAKGCGRVFVQPSGLFEPSLILGRRYASLGLV